MALDQLLTVLRREGEAEAAAIVGAAGAEARALSERCDEELRAARARLREELDRRRQADVEQALAAARHRNRQALLEARERLLQRVFDLARQRLPEAMTSPVMRRRFPEQLDQALASLGERPGTLRCHPALRTLLAAGVPTGMTLTPDAAVGSGFKLLSDDLQVEVDGTLEDQLHRQAPRLRQLVVRALGDEP